MNWFWAALFCAIFLAVSKVLVRYSLRKGTDNSAYTVLYNLFAGIICLPFIFITGLKFPTTLSSWIIFGLAVVFYALAEWTTNRALKEVELSTHVIVSKLRMIIVLLGGVLLYQESFTLGKIVGIVLILAGSAVTLVDRKKFCCPKGIIFTFLSAFFLSLGYLSDKTLVEKFSIPLYSALAFLLPSLLNFLPLKNGFSRVVTEMKAHKIVLVIAGFLYGVYFLLQLYAFSIGEVSRVIPVMELSIVFIAIMSFFFLGEKRNLLQKVLGTIIVLAGVLIVRLM